MIMTREEYIDKYLGKFIYISDKTRDDDFYIYAKDMKSCWIFRPIGVYEFDFDFEGWAGVFNKTQYSTIEIEKSKWIKKAILCVFNIPKSTM